ncbi:hypothetical protein KUTeg_011425 [Tegillarca granosa]|uniref:C1q domain-containing protein n=1 Tax=Tegillarca granosa TaxID=220873 RepID=A0ABQ9F0Z9_TEGGR|nr:hypothetical protein KUTeg_011425 [Tegillarca granosa]
MVVAPVAFTASLTQTKQILGEHQAIEYDNVITNLGNAYDPRHGHFTAPVKGLYLFSVTLMSSYGSNPNDLNAELVKNGVQTIPLYATSLDSDSTSATVLLTLNAGDMVWRPLDSFVETSDAWYCNRAVGKDTLGKFMPELSRKCSLSQIYTNHSVRTTGVTILTKRNFSAAQIMSLTGHRSVSSLAIYHRVSDDERVQMGQAITSAIRGPNKMPALSSSSSSTSLGLELSNLPVIQTNETGAASDGYQKGKELEELNDFNLDELINEFQDENAVQENINTVNMSSVEYVQSQSNVPMFSGCKIGNINITFNVQK